MLILLDVDGVVGDFLGGVQKVFRERFGIDVPHSGFTSWNVADVLPEQWMKDELDRFLAMPGFAEKMELHDGSQEGVRKLQEIGEVLFVTSPFSTSDTWMKERERWCCRHFGVSHDDVLHVTKKYAVYGDMLVDDKPSNLEKWVKRHPHGMPILWDAPYNRDVSHLRRESSWDAVVDEAERIASALKSR